MRRTGKELLDELKATIVRKLEAGNTLAEQVAPTRYTQTRSKLRDFHHWPGSRGWKYSSRLLEVVDDSLDDPSQLLVHSDRVVAVNARDWIVGNKTPAGAMC